MEDGLKTNEAVALTDQKEQEQPSWPQYFASRLKEESFKASSIARELSPDQQVGYQEKLKQAGESLVRELGIDPALFNDPAHSEIFLAICDSFVSYGTLTPEQQNPQERDFLITATRLLAGSHSRFNLEAAKRGDEGADTFVKMVGTKEDIEDRQEFAELLGYKDEEASAFLKSQIADFSQSSFLHPTREALGIKSAEDEKPFDVVVLNLSQDQPYDSQTDSFGASDWDRIVNKGKGKAAAFVRPNPDTGVWTMFISKESASDLSSKDEWIRQHKSSEIAHEYTHPQRKLRLGETGHLGMFFDEIFVCYTSKGGSYVDAKALMNLLSGLSRDNPYQKFEDIAKDENKVANFYKYFSDTFGLRSTLLATVLRPKAYSQMPHFKSVPGVDITPEKRLPSLFPLILEERLKIEPNAYQIFGEKLDPQRAESFLVQTRYAQFELPEVMQNMLEEKAKQNSPADVS